MKFFWLLTFTLAALCLKNAAMADPLTDSLFNKLNTVLANKDVYIAKKQSEIDKLKSQLAHAGSVSNKYDIYQSLYEQYKSFSYDSSYVYAKKLKLTAIVLNDQQRIASAKMKMAFTLLSSGLFKETLEELNSINLNFVSGDEKVDYYFLRARSYFDLSDYNRNPDYSAVYDPMGISSIDSALAICKPGTFNYLELKGLKDLRTGDFKDGKITYIALLKLQGLTPHQFAVNACCLSYIYEMTGVQNKSLDLLIMAAVSDIESATKETVASYKLADILYKKGDIQHAYIYIKQAMDEATFYGALHRQVKISSILPIIEAQWINQIEHQKRLLYMYSFIITLLVFAVVVFAVIVFRQLKKLRIADEIIKTANVSLQQNNEALEELNINLSTANKIKDEYIGYYFNINSIYIEKLENFQKSLEKKMVSKRYEDALATVRNLNLETEREQLFYTFDKVFLRLFPHFLEKFNALFAPGEEVVIPDGQLLSTEHRIFALIRMGIHDNDRIAKLLGYSVNTIYSYKNRVKTRSIVPNEEFDSHIMQIEAV